MSFAGTTMRRLLTVGFAAIVCALSAAAAAGETPDDSAPADSPYLDLVGIFEGRSCGPIAIDGGTVYTAFDRLFTVFDASDPDELVKIANLPRGAAHLGLEHKGDYSCLLGQAC